MFKYIHCIAIVTAASLVIHCIALTLKATTPIRYDQLVITSPVAVTIASIIHA